MEFVQGQKEYHSDDNQEDQEEEEDQEDQVNKHNHIITSKFSSTSSSSSYNNAPSSNYKASTVVLPHYDHHHHHLGDQKSWVGSSQAAEAINFMDLSLRNAKEMDHDRIIQANFGSSNGGGGGGDNSSSNWPPNDEREHMFDKVVTPSDVGKLNRLVIPKQHAEKYFPLDSSSNEKGLLLNFQDRTGKPWRFRYSYWNSSQSYVMTKGWSRFVKEKKLDAGDIVSFERGVGESGKDFLYIDWRRRPPPPPPPPQPLISPLQFVNNHQTVRVGGSGRVLYSLQRPPPSSISMPLRHHDHFHQQHFNYNNIHPYHHQQHQHQHQHQYQYQQNYHHHHHQLQHQHGGLIHDPHHGGLGNIERLRGGGGDHVIHHPMVIDSVPAFVGRHGKISTNTGTNANTNTSNSTTAAAAAKRLRLFGVNMEYQEPDDDECHQILSSSAIPHVTVASLSHHLPSSSLSPLELRLPTGPIDLSKRAKPTSLSFYLDP